MVYSHFFWVLSKKNEPFQLNEWRGNLVPVNRSAISASAIVRLDLYFIVIKTVSVMLQYLKILSQLIEIETFNNRLRQIYWIEMIFFSLLLDCKTRWMLSVDSFLWDIRNTLHFPNIISEKWLNKWLFIQLSRTHVI